MRCAAFPSPYGLAIVAIVRYAEESFSKCWVSEIILSVSVPTSFAVPARIASGRSVVVRNTSTGLPSEGASYCTPPESVKIKYDLFIK